MSSTFRCFRVDRDPQGEVVAEVTQCSQDDLPPGDVLIDVHYSSLNYKDALAARGHSGVVSRLPHVPGIDAAGKVLHSTDPQFQTGQEVLVTGFALGAPAWGGWAKRVRVPAAWVVPLPQGLSLEESMILGTAGFTAALSLEAIEHAGVGPESGEVLVTGASGGVGSLAVAILSRAGYRVAASTGKSQAHEFLKSLGAQSLLDRHEVDDTSARPLLKTRWAAAVETVGGNTLATIIRSTARHGCVAACGLVGGAELHLTVYPFLLRGVVLAGIDSAEYPSARRGEIWRRLAGPWRPADLNRLATRVTLDELPPKIDAILAGQIQGRVVVDLSHE